LGVSTATIVLLCAVVSEGNTTGGEGEDLSALQVSILALMVVKETRVVMIVNKDAKEVDILEIGVFSVVSVANLIHRLPIAENVIDRVVHWVVEQGRDIILVWGNVGRVSVEAFSHLENARSFTVLFPELAFDFGDCVNANAIETVLLNDSFHPVF
jgi:predicted small secreted protein